MSNSLADFNRTKHNRPTEVQIHFRLHLTLLLPRPGLGPGPGPGHGNRYLNSGDSTGGPPRKIGAPGGCGAREGPFRLNLIIQPITKLNGVPRRPANDEKVPFNLISACSECTEYFILKISDLGKMTGSNCPSSRKKMGFENAHPLSGPVGPIFQIPAKNRFWKIPDLGTTLPLQISTFSHPHDFLT